MGGRRRSRRGALGAGGQSDADEDELRRPNGDGVQLWTFAQAGHTWPGDRGDGRFFIQFFHGRISTELDATQEIWRFYRERSA